MLLFTDAEGFSRALVDSRDLCLQFSNAGFQYSFGCCCLPMRPCSSSTLAMSSRFSASLF